MALKRKDELYMTGGNGNTVKPSTVDKTAPTGSVSPSTTSKEETKPSTTTTPTTTAPSTKIQGLTNKAPSFDKYTPEGYSPSAYKPSDAVLGAAQALTDQLAKTPTQNVSPWQTQLNDTINAILNREKFQFDINGDAFYAQAKDRAINQAKMASADVMGQAAAMTGGYGNSYAATVGNQAYNAQMEGLNDTAMQLYQMAYDRYAREGQDLKDAYSILATEEQNAYNRFRDEYNDYLVERDYLTGRYESEKADDYNKYVDDRNFDYGKYADDRNFGYATSRDDIADKKWQSEFDLAIDQYNKNLELSQNQAIAEATEERAQELEDIGAEVGKFKTNEEMADYVALLFNRGEITEDEAMDLLDKYSYPDLADRDWSIAEENFVAGVPSPNTVLSDGLGNQTTLGKLQEELGMSDSEFAAWFEQQLKKWGFNPL